MANDKEILFETKRRDGFNGRMVKVTILFDPAESRTICRWRGLSFVIDREVDAASARWRVVNSPEHRNLASNKFFKSAVEL